MKLMYLVRLPLRAFGLPVLLGLAIVLGLWGPPDWHKHVHEGIELLHAHSHLGVHQHPHWAGTEGDERAPGRQGERQPPDDDSSERSEFLSFSGAAGEATTPTGGTVVAMAPSDAETPTPTSAIRRAWHGPRESRGPPSCRV